ncbi:MAG: thioredoxin [Thiobacillus sp. SCN 63-374]|uniref:TlpA family protein disulfide reductase n=1 Tax=Thiobacillus sp. 0-1251 TaxID=1895858 RepID=UPI00086EDAB6|nr:TlpA disulfide reductase family protein [Thiobacillus sp. 0-1251]MBS0309794.1 TlpA family protein disulfide reductase [Pseudomonadota bacterium]MBS0328574.1 TlpA family protein disulfide reductase [Pseudomonadota bacterium]ODU48820.1 MAG: thioredoxin [Thiobacillus sp. SCN 63-374]OJY60099.1 MAG: thioredoxin [Thiobacillus sp. 0-1251]
MQTLQGGRFYPIWLAGLLLALLASWAHAGGFTLTDTNGKTHTLDGYKGKWVLVNFWATWCPPCQEEIPDLIALHGEKKNNLVVIGIAMDYRNAKQVTDFADGLLVDYPIVLGNAQVASQIGPVQGLPTTYLYNPDGKMVAQQVGAITRESVESFIAKKSARTKK